MLVLLRSIFDFEVPRDRLGGGRKTLSPLSYGAEVTALSPRSRSDMDPDASVSFVVSETVI